MAIVGTNEDVYEYPVTYMNHKVYTVETALDEIRQKLRDAFLLTNLSYGGVNVMGELFQLLCFYPHTDPVSDFVLLETYHDVAGDKVFSDLWTRTVIDSVKPKDVARIDIWFSMELKKFLGDFRVGKWEPVGSASRVVRHGVALDCLVAEKVFSGNPCDWFHTVLGSCPNRRTVLHVKSNLIQQMSEQPENNFPTLAVCKIPADSNISIELMQPTIKWYKAARSGRVSQFRVALKDSDGELMPFTKGNILMVNE